MKVISIVFIFISLNSYGIEKKLLSRKEIYKQIDREIDHRPELREDDKKKLKKEIREAEITTLRKARALEAELKEANSKNAAVKDFFEVKKSLLQKKIIGGEEFEVLKEPEILKDEFVKKGNAIVNTFRKETKNIEMAATPDFKEEETDIQYPIPVQHRSRLADRAKTHPVKIENETKREPFLLWPVLSAGIILLLHLIKRKMAK